MLKRTAPMVPMMVTIMATCLPRPFSLSERDSAEMPEDQASRKVVVTVERTRMRRAAMPRPALTMTTAMSDSPVTMAAPMPMTYIHTEIRP